MNIGCKAFLCRTNVACTPHVPDGVHITFVRTKMPCTYENLFSVGIKYIIEFR